VRPLSYLESDCWYNYNSVSNSRIFVVNTWRCVSICKWKHLIYMWCFIYYMGQNQYSSAVGLQVHQEYVHPDSLWMSWYGKMSTYFENIPKDIFASIQIVTRYIRLSIAMQGPYNCGPVWPVWKGITFRSCGALLRIMIYCIWCKCMKYYASWLMLIFTDIILIL